MPSSLLAVFVLPLAVILSFPHIYRLLIDGAYSKSEEQQLQEVASLMDSIYTTLANMTFIPHASIKRGPHHINASDIPCNLSPSVIRLMELLPYVDASLVQTPDWIFGGVFIDYRRSDHLNSSSCHPLLGASFGWTGYTRPTSIALTEWGTAGWNSDGTLVMLYDTNMQTISMFDGGMWVHRDVARRLFGVDFQDIHGNPWDSTRDSRDGLSALEILEAVRDNFQTLKWIPWKTSHKKNGFGVPPEQIKKLLLQNGWPGSFSADQFNADFVRAKHKPSGRGYARPSDRSIAILDPRSSHKNEWYDKGAMWWHERRIAEHKTALRAAKSDDQRWLQKWNLQRATWNLEQDRADLQAAKEDVKRLCPDGICVAPEDLILWEFRSLERAYEKSAHVNQTLECSNRLSELVKYMPPDPTRFDLCLDQVALENRWLHLAYTQSRAAALKHCAATGSELLPPDSMESRAKAKIAMLEEEIMRGEARLKKMEAWRQQIPENAERARKRSGREMGPVMNRNKKSRARIEWIEEELKQGGSELWDWLQDEERRFYGT